MLNEKTYTQQSLFHKEAPESGRLTAHLSEEIILRLCLEGHNKVKVAERLLKDGAYECRTLREALNIVETVLAEYNYKLSCGVKIP